MCAGVRAVSLNVGIRFKACEVYRRLRIERSAINIHCSVQGHLRPPLRRCHLPAIQEDRAQKIISRIKRLARGDRYLGHGEGSWERNEKTYEKERLRG